ncbi:hypothetical protein [Nannocystis bainbridge]|uniref:Uncharacterized protein n=1 Tax=Nannocystis bainbridge TaxID=2995303 RepID=A0ABT5DSQ5_9BACT|nr:hypothetical protein [Nannocystis bainbridge]MDC0716210.1 hypothetical protein [Nannocystis bainbridge]
MGPLEWSSLLAFTMEVHARRLTVTTKIVTQPPPATTVVKPRRRGEDAG